MVNSTTSAETRAVSCGQMRRKLCQAGSTSRESTCRQIDRAAQVGALQVAETGQRTHNKRCKWPKGHSCKHKRKEGDRSLRVSSDRDALTLSYSSQRC